MKRFANGIANWEADQFFEPEPLPKRICFKKNIIVIWRLDQIKARKYQASLDVECDQFRANCVRQSDDFVRGFCEIIISPIDCSFSASSLTVDFTRENCVADDYNTVFEFFGHVLLQD